MLNSLSDPRNNRGPLDYERIPFEKITVKAPSTRFSPTTPSRQPKGTVFGAAGISNEAQLRNAMGDKAYNAIPKFKKGGMVKKTGLAVVHKGEKVIPKDALAKKKRELAAKCK